MRAATAHHQDSDPARAVCDAYAALVHELGGPPQRLFAQASVGHDREALRACALADLAPADIAGALVIFCAGCMLTVRDRIDHVVAGLTDGLGGAPFLGSFTFGEQGSFVGGENRHGNLMISVTVFARE